MSLFISALDNFTPSQFGKNARDKFNYFVEATSVAYFDETKPNAAAVLQAPWPHTPEVQQYSYHLLGRSKIGVIHQDRTS